MKTEDEKIQDLIEQGRIQTATRLFKAACNDTQGICDQSYSDLKMTAESLRRVADLIEENPDLVKGVSFAAVTTEGEKDEKGRDPMSVSFHVIGNVPFVAGCYVHIEGFGRKAFTQMEPYLIQSAIEEAVNGTDDVEVSSETSGSPEFFDKSTSKTKH